MEALQLDKPTAKRLYKNVPEWFQDILKSTFGKEVFSGKITERIKTFEDACEELGIKPGDVFNSQDDFDDIARKKLKVIAKALNEGWFPDWDNSSERKWYPWFNLSSSGFGFVVSVYVYTDSLANCGSRLCFKTEELSNYFGRQFIELHKIHLI